LNDLLNVIDDVYYHDHENVNDPDDVEIYDLENVIERTDDYYDLNLIKIQSIKSIDINLFYLVRHLPF